MCVQLSGCCLVSIRHTVQVRLGGGRQAGCIILNLAVPHTNKHTHLCTRCVKQRNCVCLETCRQDSSDHCGEIYHAAGSFYWSGANISKGKKSAPIYLQGAFLHAYSSIICHSEVRFLHNSLVFGCWRRMCMNTITSSNTTWIWASGFSPESLVQSNLRKYMQIDIRQSNEENVMQTQTTQPNTGTLQAQKIKLR